MKIGDVARELDLSVQTLRFYEKQGLLRARKTSGGTRLYQEDDLHRIQAIRALSQLGIPLERLRLLADIRPGSDSGDQACRSVSGELGEISETLRQLRRSIDSTLEDIEAAERLVQRCRGCQTPPRRRNCAPCPVAAGLADAQILQLIWDQDHED